MCVRELSWPGLVGEEGQGHPAEMRWPGADLRSLRFSTLGLFHEDFGDGRTLPDDVESVRGFIDADTLKVEVFGGSVGSVRFYCFYA